MLGYRAFSNLWNDVIVDDDETMCTVVSSSSVRVFREGLGVSVIFSVHSASAYSSMCCFLSQTLLCLTQKVVTQPIEQNVVNGDSGKIGKPVVRVVGAGRPDPPSSLITEHRRKPASAKTMIENAMR